MRHLFKVGLRTTCVAVLASTLWGGAAWSAITTNVVGSGNTGGSDSTTLTIGVTIASGSDTSLYVCVADTRGDQGSITSVTWNGTGLTKIAEVDAADIYGATLWRLKAPETGAFNVVVTSPVSSRLAAAVIALDGVDQTTSERTHSTNATAGNNAQPTVTVANSQNGDYVLDCVGRRQLEDDTATAGAGQTSIAQSRANGFNDIGVLSSNEAATGANTVMSWTMSGGNVYSYASIGIPLIAATGGGGATVRNRMLIGVGQ